MLHTAKKPANGLQGTYSLIMERLSKCKPLLDNPSQQSWSSIIQELTQIAALSEAFTEQRLNSTKTGWNDLADSLDQEGVNLWNISGLIRKGPEEGGDNAHIAALRLAAFRLVEAGLETKPGIDTLLHVLQLANKTGTSFSEIGNNVAAASVMTSAAKYEEQLRNANGSDESQQRSIACATVMYFYCRMEAAWKEGNYTVADYMSRKIADDSHRLGILPSHVRELLVHKFHQIGSSMLKESPSHDGSKASDAVQWLQRAFSVADLFVDKEISGAAGLKIPILRTMARAYFLSESYDRAETVLDELVPTIDGSPDDANSEYQEVRWLRLAVLKRRKAGDLAFLNAFKSIIDHMDFSEANITEILQDLKTLSYSQTLVSSIQQHCLERALRCQTSEPEHIHRLILSLIIHCSKDDDHARAMKTLESTFTSVCEADVELPPIACTACLTLIWQYAGRHYKAKKWSPAADWYTSGSHKLFTAGSPSSYAKCLRKAALCHIELKEYALASTVIRRCPTTEAPTHYIIFLTAVHQGLEDEAVRAIRDMLQTPDFDRKMLLLATQVSHQSEMKGVLLSVLESLLKTLKVGTNGELILEAMTLVRCIVKLILGLLVQPAANRPVLIVTLVNQFKTARILTEAASVHKVTSLIFKDISWLWRTAYNCAVQGCSEWENAGEQISELFSIAKELIEVCCHASPVSIDADLCLHLVNATFAAVCGRVFSIRELMVATGKSDEAHLHDMCGDIDAAKNKIVEIMNKGIIQDAHDSDHVQYFLHALRVFEAESLAELRDWDKLSEVVEDIVQSGSLATGTYEAISDILWLDEGCPVNVLYKCLEAILRASLANSSLSVEKFSRWLRTICTICLARNSDADRLKAIGYVEQALSVMEDHHESIGNEAYPMDERQWLLATTFNTGTECLHASMLDEAKRWFEASTVLCRFVPDGKECAAKISETYTSLLSHYRSTN